MRSREVWGFDLGLNTSFRWGRVWEKGQPPEVNFSEGRNLERWCILYNHWADGNGAAPLETSPQAEPG